MWRFLLLLLPFAAVAQYPNDSKRDNIWLIGNTVGGDTIYPHWGGNILSFTNGYIEVSFNEIILDFDFTNSSICDTSGNLLYFSNGLFLANRNFQYFPGIDTVNWPSYYWGSYGYRLPQGMLSLPIPNHDSLYTTINTPLFAVIVNNGVKIFTPFLYKNIIDMSLDNGLGDAILLNQPIINDTIMSGLLVACRHANGRDWWIPIKVEVGSKFYMLLLDPMGLHISHEQEIGVGLPTHVLGQASFSPDGSKYVMGGGMNQDIGYTFNIYNFDRCTGLFSNPQQIVSLLDSMNEYPIGCAVSPNSRYLYLSEGSRVRQCDLWANDVFGSCEVVAVVDGFIDTLHPEFPIHPGFKFMQSGPDDKIYIVTGNTHYFSYINQPDLPGTACDIIQHGIQLLSFNAFSIPNYPNFRLGPLDGCPCDTLGIDNIVATKQPPPPQEAISVYPNPATDAVAVQFAQPQYDCTIALYNELGEVVLQKPLSTLVSTVSLQGLAAGVYFYSITQGEAVVSSGKVVKL